jgi:hypothetical protein
MNSARFPLAAARQPGGTLTNRNYQSLLLGLSTVT